MEILRYAIGSPYIRDIDYTRMDEGREDWHGKKEGVNREKYREIGVI